MQDKSGHKSNEIHVRQYSNNQIKYNIPKHAHFNNLFLCGT